MFLSSNVYDDNNCRLWFMSAKDTVDESAEEHGHNQQPSVQGREHLCGQSMRMPMPNVFANLSPSYRPGQDQGIGAERARY